MRRFCYSLIYFSAFIVTLHFAFFCLFVCFCLFCFSHCRSCHILGDPGAVSRVAGIFVGESRTWAKVYCKNETDPWAITLTEPVPEAFEIPAFDWAEKYFSAQSAKRTSRATLLPSYTKLFSSSIAAVAWAFQQEDSRRDFQKKIQRSRGNRKL